jgi:hypothetical protein
MISIRNMEELIAKYRVLDGGSAPGPIRLQIPGWAGKDKNHGDGAEPQPWHCPPFVDASTYGHELVYPYKSECRVRRIGGEVVFEGDFSNEGWLIGENGEYVTGDQERKKTPPMMLFASGHYGMSGAYDIEPPDGYALRTEPHPRFYTDQTGTVPCLVPGHIQRWWSRIFFVVFKAPREGETHIFSHGEPYGQILVVPQKNPVRFSPFSEEERLARENRDRRIGEHGSKIASKRWIDKSGFSFDDKYRVLCSSYARGGYAAVDETMTARIQTVCRRPKTNIPRRLFRPKK